MPDDGYRALRLPTQLMERVQLFVSTNHEGFQTTPEVVKAAIREFLDRREGPYAPPELIKKAVDEYLRQRATTPFPTDQDPAEPRPADPTD